MNKNDDRPPSPKKTPAKQAKGKPTRQLKFRARVRRRFRVAVERALGANAAWSLAFVLVALSLLGSQRCGVSYPDYSLGDTASENVRAEFDVHVPDHRLTDERRNEALRSIEDLYVHDQNRGQRLAAEVVSLFEAGRAALEAPDSNAEPDGLDPAVRDLLRRHRYSSTLERELTSVLRQVMGNLIVGNKALLARQNQILVSHLPSGRDEVVDEYSAILDLDQARAAVRDAVKESVTLPAREREVVGRFLARFVDANLSYDPEGTQKRRRQASDAVQPVLVKVARGDVLVAEGEEISQQTLDRLNAARSASRGRLGLLDLLSLLFLTSMLAFFLFRYATYHQRQFKKLQHLHALLVLVTLSTLLIGKGLIWVAERLVGTLQTPFNQIEAYYYLIPLGAGSIMVALLTNSRIAMVYSAFAGILFGAMAESLYTMLWGMLVQWMGIYAISTYRERAALLRAGLVVGGVGAISALAMDTLRGEVPLSASLYGAGLGFVGGAIGVGLLISFTLPLLEGLFRVLTDVRLLELSSSSHPLLSELAVKAPGTYNHSLVVGTLAEEAAKAIGGNALFCRVAAFYHDIGKMLKPEYYVENQRGTNPHDRLSPSMSALVVAAHVKDGIKLARDAGLPEQIIDIIPQHHGTRLMTYFYEKAKKETDPSMGATKEEDFRYPGPKPLTKEAAIFMMADGVEAAARTVDEPSPNRLREVIRKVTNAIVLDEQLDRCDLTFTDLNRIEEAFLRCLVSMHHQRVDYPGFDFRRKAEPKPGGDTIPFKAEKGR